MPVNTTCSSSLVATHLGCQALRNHECSLALVGGAHAIIDPERAWRACSRLRALSPTGRCRTFSSLADGFVRAEGAGVLVLERLSDARRNGHPVLALIRGSAINQDGRSNGPTAPNGPSQEDVIREALAAGRRLAPSQVGYLECHGTGTVLGDPIRGAGRGGGLWGEVESNALVLGSLKSNIGHAEAAAGVAEASSKATLALQHGLHPQRLCTPRSSIHIFRGPSCR